MADQDKKGRLSPHPLSSIGYMSVFMLAFAVSSCKHEKTPAPQQTQRTYRMGFQHSAPKPDPNLSYQALTLWTQHADAAIISIQVPWALLYSGTAPEQYIRSNFTELVNYYRGKKFKLWVYVDPANGLNRSADANDLAAMGKSIAQPSVQALYGRFTFLMDSLLKPDHLGLALETNLIRGQSPDSIYKGIKTASNHTAALIRSYDTQVKLSVSVQADYAWGVLTASPYQGIKQDFTDFPFMQELGISSYPYFVYNQPQDIPSDYYSKLTTGHPIPVFVSEGGWSSQTVDKYTETFQKQQDYMTKQSQLLDQVKATAWFQLLYSDIETNTLPSDIPANINLFAFIGLADTTLKPKPALSTWDNILKRPLTPGH